MYGRAGMNERKGSKIVISSVPHSFPQSGMQMFTVSGARDKRSEAIIASFLFILPTTKYPLLQRCGTECNLGAG